MIMYVPPAKHTDSFAMTEFNVSTLAGGNSPSYNIELAARHVGGGTTSQFFAAKLVYNQIGVTDYPWLVVVDETQFNPLTGAIMNVTENVDYIKLGKSGVDAKCPGNENLPSRCEQPPLLDATKSVVLQIATWKDTDLLQTIITGAVGWDCPTTSGRTIYDCAKVCCLTKMDSTFAKLDVKGQWWVLGHHTNSVHKLHWFRAGDAETGSNPPQ